MRAEKISAYCQPGMKLEAIDNTKNGLSPPKRRITIKAIKSTDPGTR